MSGENEPVDNNDAHYEAMEDHDMFHEELHDDVMHEHALDNYAISHGSDSNHHDIPPHNPNPTGILRNPICSSSEQNHDSFYADDWEQTEDNFFNEFECEQEYASDPDMFAKNNYFHNDLLHSTSI